MAARSSSARGDESGHDGGHGGDAPWRRRAEVIELALEMSELSLTSSVARAEARLARGAHRPRSDLGKSRLPAAVEARLHWILGRDPQPSMSDAWREIDAFCR